MWVCVHDRLPVAAVDTALFEDGWCAWGRQGRRVVFAALVQEIEAVCKVNDDQRTSDCYNGHNDGHTVVLRTSASVSGCCRAGCRGGMGHCTRSRTRNRATS